MGPLKLIWIELSLHGTSYRTWMVGHFKAILNFKGGKKYVPYFDRRILSCSLALLESIPSLHIRDCHYKPQKGKGKTSEIGLLKIDAAPSLLFQAILIFISNHPSLDLQPKCLTQLLNKILKTLTRNLINFRLSLNVSELTPPLCT